MNAIMNFMRRNYKVLLVVAALSVALWSFIPRGNKNDPEKDKLLLELLAFVINKGHYAPKDIDDNFSKIVYKDYLTALDPSKRFFLQSDIDEFSKYETLVDDAIRNKDLTFFDLTYNRLMQRMEESKAYYKDILAKPFDYNVDESFNIDYDKMPYAKSTAELKEKWRKQIKLSTLSSLSDRLKLQEDKAKGIKEEPVADEESDDTEPAPKTTAADEAPKTFEQLEKETRENSLKSLNEYFGFIKDLNREDYFSVFVNTIAETFDPHTSYFAPEDKDKFDMSISGKFDGIGARLQKKNDFTEITELISGGPAWRGKELEPGDVVLKVGQGKEEPVDVVGMRIDDVVKKIKGPKGTEVRLTVKKVDGSMKVISIIRDVVEIEETYAKSSIVKKDGKLYGVIYLPKFYIDFENKDSRDAAKDVALEIDRLKKQGIQGLVFDVRDNGGGSLRTVVDIAGLFIDQGPIVQVKSTGKNKEVLPDNDSKVQWDGPLVVMVNNFSASASEILAAAIQDYKRGVIIGSKQSYGKGTVQNVIDLNQFVRNSATGDLGALKTTTQKFYRINGGSTQLKGVASDVEMPDKYTYIEVGERDSENAMPWDKIDPANYNVWDRQPNFEKAIANSKKRVAQSQQFRLIDENAQWLGKRKDENDYSLNIDKFRKEQENIKAENKKYKAIGEYKTNLEFTSLPYETAQMEKDEVLKEKRKRWHESLAKDAYVEEALNVLSDLQDSGSKPTVNLKKREKLVKS
ncbi:tail-specific protease [Flavobacterium magnum]|uniref:Tail-specific protease n=1 Tax=Flavobacterium magnum TaxID=2162713 RepID=A0A2S0RES3_9FLAO|nr:carboxy terminal-processing peptidase [Flavobacterium magnum]AWA29601.1 tail-specific protease [Flavobacterium magnum]